MRYKSVMRRRLLASTIVCGALASVGFGGAALAQVDAAAADAENSVEAVVVTGTLLKRSLSEIASPVTVMTTDSLQKAGISTATDAIRSVTADGAGSIGNGFQSGFSAGGSAVSLRNLGVSSTLILIDGLRSANFPINDDGHNAYVDLNSIPFGLIDRVDVLKDGASSTYGADAIGGVVNLITKKHVVGVHGSLEGGASYKGDAEHSRGDITVGYGDYAASGWNVYVNAEFQRDGRVSNNSRGFPYNTRDLSSIGGIDNNSADSSPTTATPTAMVGRVHVTDLNDPRSSVPGGLAAPTEIYHALNLNCANGTYTAALGTGCKWDLEKTYNQLAPLQKRYGFDGRLSVRLSDNVEGYVTGSYTHDFVSIKNQPRNIRQNAPFGASPTLSTINPGVALPVYVCSSGINCATAADRRLNPNNPFATAYANDPANGAARIYYLFGDIPAGSDRTNEVIRGAAGLAGTFEGWTWKLDAVGARDNLTIDQYGWTNNANLINAINTGSYNFVNPSLNSAAIREFVGPAIHTPSKSTMLSLDGSASREIYDLPAGPVQLAIGGQARREVLVNNNQNARLDTNGLSTASAFGRHTVLAAFFELNAPITSQINATVSGRYDHYSEGFKHFSPKAELTYKPFDMLQLRGTYSQGFRAPTFAEAGARSQYSAFSTVTPPLAFQQAHGGSITGAGANTNPYAQAFQSGVGLNGNPSLKPETSKSYTIGAVLNPVPWGTLSLDFYHVKKSNLIVAGPDAGAARSAYFSKTNVTDACAAVAAIGPGYSCSVIDAVDPLFPNALPRIVVMNTPFVNANHSITEGLDFSASGHWTFDDFTITSRAEWTDVLAYNLYTPTGVQKYAGTMGPHELSSGNGTPKYRANWQTTVTYGKFDASATVYYMGRIKAVAADEASRDTRCSINNQYSLDPVLSDKFCYVKAFTYVNGHVGYEIRDGLNLYADMGNMFNKKAPIAPGSYSSSPNFLASFHYAGLIGRTYKVGVTFDY